MRLACFVLLACSRPAPSARADTDTAFVSSQTAFRLTSPDFHDRGAIPVAHTECGENLSPGLSWENVPAGTRSLVLLCEYRGDSGRRNPRWILFNVPAGVSRLEQGASGKGFSDGTVEAVGYRGPSSPAGKRHRYSFRLYALDTVLSLPEVIIDAAVIDKAIQGHVLASAELTGTYKRGAGWYLGRWWK